MLVKVSLILILLNVVVSLKVQMNINNSFKFQQQRVQKSLITSLLSLSLIVGSSVLPIPSLVFADDDVSAESAAVVSTPAAASSSSSSEAIPKVPLYIKKSSDLQQYVDIGRGFKLLRPFGFNEFDGAGGGYAVKFASLFDGMFCV